MAYNEHIQYEIMNMHKVIGPHHSHLIRTLIAFSITGKTYLITTYNDIIHGDINELTNVIQDKGSFEAYRLIETDKRYTYMFETAASLSALNLACIESVYPYRLDKN